MKTHGSFIVVLLTASQLSFATIRNGYIDVEGARSSLKSITILLNNSKGLSFQERRSMRSKRDALIHYISWYDVTEKLLSQFRVISPALYASIDTLKDRRGRNVDVYVRFVDEEQLSPGVGGQTNVEQDKDDPDLYRSTYGAYTVSVAVQAGRKSLQLLAHEFGHVKYQVENLAEYSSYYDQHYGSNAFTRTSVGHNDSDESGRHAKRFVQSFHEENVKFLRSRKNRGE